jgi:hypothetical protein
MLLELIGSLMDITIILSTKRILITSGIIFIYPTMKTIDGIRDIAIASPGSYDAYNAVANIMMAYSLQLTTDMFGDIPYDQAFLGSENFKPGYETQEQIYADIQQLLSDAIAVLGDATLIGDDVSLPGPDDYVYSGDLEAWIAFAHALKARCYLHVVEVDLRLWQVA